MYAGGTSEAVHEASPVVVQQERLPAALGQEQWGTIGNTRGGGVFLRTAPSRASDKQRLQPGTTVRLTGRTHAADGLEWSEVEVSRQTGWVASRYLLAHDGEPVHAAGATS